VGVALFPCPRWVSAEGSGERRTGLGRSAEARSEEEGTGACFGKQKALLSGPGIGLLIFSSTNLEMNQILKIIRFSPTFIDEKAVIFNIFGSSHTLAVDHKKLKNEGMPEKICS
jgi:hypothetical protein